jgi:hypothetical protein
LQLLATQLGINLHQPQRVSVRLFALVGRRVI